MNRTTILSGLAFAASFGFATAYAQVEANVDNDNELTAATPTSSDAGKSDVDALREQIYRDMQHE